MTGPSRGIAIVGASDSGIPWTEWLIGSLEKHRYPGEVWLVNPRREHLLGRPVHPDLTSLPAAPELGVVMTRARVAVDQVERLLDLGTRRIVVVSNGFAEIGTDEGVALQRRLVELSTERDALLVGPNCIGYASLHEGIAAISQPIPHGITAGDVSILSQSGGLTGALLGAVRQQGLGVDHAYSLGNGAAFGVTQAIEQLVARRETRVVLGVVESLRDRTRIERAAELAHRNGTTIALLLLGASEGGRGVARSHTGAVVSEQRLAASWLADLGIATATSVEELARVASVTRQVPASRAGMGVVATISGGGAGLAADLAARHDAPLAELSPATRERIVAALPEGAYVGNPLDISTGDAAAVYAALADDPAVGFIIEPWALPFPTGSDEYHWQRRAMERFAELRWSTGLPVLITSIWRQEPSSWMREFAERSGVEVSEDLELTLAALGALARTRRAARRGEPAAATHGLPSGTLVAEAGARERLEAAGIAVVTGREFTDADDLIAAAATMAGPFVVKLSLDSVGHKERVGGVRVGVARDELAAACAAIRANAIAAGVSDGSDVRFLLTEMMFGPELLVSVLTDPLVGPMITIGVGGWSAEAGTIFATVPIPAAPGELGRRLAATRLPLLLGAARLGQLVDYAEAVARACTTGPLAGFAEVELNPVILDARGAVAVDALLIA
jgi:acyl-CoA synthetase (NDP forming)